MPSFREQLIHQLQCEGAFTEAGAVELVDAHRAEVLGEVRNVAFFEPDHTYRRSNGSGDWEFRVVAVTRCPANTLQAIGWLCRVGTDVWHPSSRGTLDWVRAEWADVTEAVAS